MPEINNSSQIEWSESNGDLTATIVSGSVTATELASNSVDTAELVDGAVTEAKIDSGAVTETKIDSGAVTETKIGSNVVTNAKLADVATSTIKGRVTAGTGDPEDLTASQVRTLLNVADGAQPGTVTSVATGSGLTGGTITTTGTLSHATPSPVATNSNNSNGTVIQDLTFDSFGHTASVGTTNLDSRYYTESEVNSLLNAKLNLSGGNMTGNIDMQGNDIEGIFGLVSNTTSSVSHAMAGFHAIKSYDNWIYHYSSRTEILRYDNPASTTDIFIITTNATTDVFAVEANGDVLSATGSYGTFSDARLKTNVKDASTQWHDIKNLRVVNYQLNKDIENLGDDAPVMLGVVAQDLEAAGMNGLVSNNVRDGENQQAYKSVKYSVLYMKAVKALQEAMERIEILESKVEALGA